MRGAAANAGPAASHAGGGSVTGATWGPQAVSSQAQVPSRRTPVVLSHRRAGGIFSMPRSYTKVTLKVVAILDSPYRAPYPWQVASISASALRSARVTVSSYCTFTSTQV